MSVVRDSVNRRWDQGRKQVGEQQGPRDSYDVSCPGTLRGSEGLSGQIQIKTAIVEFSVKR